MPRSRWCSPLPFLPRAFLGAPNPAQESAPYSTGRGSTNVCLRTWQPERKDGRGGRGMCSHRCRSCPGVVGVRSERKVQVPWVARALDKLKRKTMGTRSSRKGRVSVLGSPNTQKFGRERWEVGRSAPERSASGLGSPNTRRDGRETTSG